jgi:hypothetical protein
MIPTVAPGFRLHAQLPTPWLNSRWLERQSRLPRRRHGHSPQLLEAGNVDRGRRFEVGLATDRACPGAVGVRSLHRANIWRAYFPL